MVTLLYFLCLNLNSVSLIFFVIRLASMTNSLNFNTLMMLNLLKNMELVSIVTWNLFEVYVHYRCGNIFKKAQHSFNTDWNSFLSGRDWCLEILRSKADRGPDLTIPLHYLLDSTANYHIPVCMFWVVRLQLSIRQSPALQSAKLMLIFVFWCILVLCYIIPLFYPAIL